MDLAITRPKNIVEIENKRDQRQRDQRIHVTRLDRPLYLSELRHAIVKKFERGCVSLCRYSYNSVTGIFKPESNPKAFCTSASMVRPIIACPVPLIASQLFLFSMPSCGCSIVTVTLFPSMPGIGCDRSASTLISSSP